MSESELEYRSGALKLEHGLHNIGHSFKRFKARARYRAHAHILYSSILHGNSIGIFIRDRSNFHNSFPSAIRNVRIRIFFFHVRVSFKIPHDFTACLNRIYRIVLSIPDVVM